MIPFLTLNLFILPIYRDSVPDSVIIDVVKLFKENMKVSIKYFVSTEQDEKTVKKIPISIEGMNNYMGFYKAKSSKYFFCKDGVFGPLNWNSNDDNRIFCCSSGRHTKNYQELIQEKSYFSYVSPIPFLQYLFPLIRTRLCKPTEVKNELRDIKDGSEYQRLTSITAAPTICLYIGWDGGAVSKNNSHAFWPLVGFISELDVKYRQRIPLPIAVYYGNDHPSCEMLQPLVDDLIKTFSHEVTFKYTQAGETVVKGYKVVLLCAICDAPARAKAMNSHDFKGTYGCSCCLIKTERVKGRVGNIRSRHIYPMTNGHPLRKHADWVKLAAEVKAGKKDPSTAFGIKGFTPLLELPYVDIVSLFPQEAMHAFFIGNTKTFIDHLCKDLQPIEIKGINDRLTDYKFPTNVLRVMPTNIQHNQLKAFDLELLLFYAFFLFEEVAHPEKYECFVMYSFLISRLSRKVVYKSELASLQNHVEKLICRIKSTFEKADNTMFTSNMHSIAHCVANVQKFGPLIQQSSYQVEDIIGKAVKAVKTGTNVPQQVLNKLFRFSSLSAMKMAYKDLSADKDYRTFNATKKSKNGNVEQVSNGKQYYTSEAHGVRKQSNDNFVKLKDGRYMTILSITPEMDFRGYEFQHSPFVQHGLEFEHLKNARINRRQFVEFKLSNIDVPFAALRKTNEEYILIDLFNRHL